MHIPIPTQTAMINTTCNSGEPSSKSVFDSLFPDIVESSSIAMSPTFVGVIITVEEDAIDNDALAVVKAEYTNWLVEAVGKAVVNEYDIDSAEGVVMELWLDF